MLAYNNAFGLTTFAANILTMLAIAAGTDYGIFLVGRYQEARREGEDRETAYYTTFKGVAPVVLGSGLTIAGATYCLSFCRLPWFSTMGAPVAIGMLVVVAAGLTLGPAVVFLGSRFGLFEKKNQARGKLWRRVGTAVVRWPAPIFAVSLAAVLVGMVALPGFKTSYNDRHYLPETAPSNIGYAAADRHFSEARMNPDLLMIEADHDMRNTSDMLVLDKVAKNEIRTRRHRDDPGHHPAAGNSHPAQLNSVPEQHPEPDDHAEHEVPQRQNGRHSENGRPDADHDRRDDPPGESHP